MTTREDKKFSDALAKTQSETTEVTLSTGVVLRGKQAPPLILISIMASYPRPKPPTWLSPQLGRQVENPEDPDYISQVKAWEMESSNATLNAMIALGTEVVTVPKGMFGPDSKKWLDEYSVLNMDMFPDNKTWCYLTWIKFKAVGEASDLEKIREVVGRLSGVPETDVQSAETFSGSNPPTG